MPYTPDPARVRELAERLIVHRATGPGTAADALGYDSSIPENEGLSDGDWGVLMAAVDQAAKGAKISVRFPGEPAPAAVDMDAYARANAHNRARGLLSAESATMPTPASPEPSPQEP